VIRVGQGVDAHRFATDTARPLVLGGVTVPDAVGLEGHSDADVATHALCDAVLGAAGLGDLGRHFPATAEHAGARSLDLLATCCAMAREAGFTVGNAQVTVVAEAPRLGGLLDEMAEALGGVLGAPVAVSATSTDGLGAIGRNEGIAATAVVLLVDPTRP
jgi:2-C-methyl-D-erythritol 2,4-cyclodiphosphate synthase